MLPGQELRHYGWDGSFVLYNDSSGDTHLLEAGAMRVLLALRAAPRGEEELAACYTEPCEPAAGMAPVFALLDDLAALSLVECAPC
ncbi:MAG: HPr-rel-A system PqqD family peptide chaperone [Telluria sp.]